MQGDKHADQVTVMHVVTPTHTHILNSMFQKTVHNSHIHKWSAFGSNLP